MVIVYSIITLLVIVVFCISVPSIEQSRDKDIKSMSWPHRAKVDFLISKIEEY